MLRLSLLLVGSAACAEAAGDRAHVLLVTTTTVEDSGLLDELIAAYDAGQSEYRLITTAVGSGAALEIGRRGDATVLLTHDPVGERAFAAAGHAVEQGPVMENEFVVAGPPADPAGLAGGEDAVAAFRRIGNAGAPFVSRGDSSGTHRKEGSLWRAAGLEPWSSRPGWYIEAGSGMATTLHLASDRQAYVLTDRATLRHLGPILSLTELVRGDEELRNPYAYSLPARSPDPVAARHFIEWLTGAGQVVIARYGVERFGEPLFRPTATRADTVAVESAAPDPAAAGSRSGGDTSG